MFLPPCFLSLFIIFNFISTLSFANNTTPQTRQHIAIVEFKVVGNIDMDAAGQTIAEMLIAPLLNSGQYDLYERTLLRAIIDEQNMSQTEYVSEEHMANEYGKLYGVQSILTGSISKFGNALTISARLIHTTTGRILKSANITIPKNKLDKIPQYLKQLVQRLTHSSGQSNKKQYHLTINATPDNARIYIMNIQPKYRPGMLLPSGRYIIRVKSKGYKTLSKKVINITDADKVVNIRLQKAKVLTPIQTTQNTLPAIKMIKITGDCFNMGSPPDMVEFNKDERQHFICVNDFLISQHEITVAEYAIFSQQTGYTMQTKVTEHNHNHPVVKVSWHDAIAFTNWLSRKTKKYYRLPTEAEWEFAARAGTNSTYYTGNCIHSSQANFDGRHAEKHCPKSAYRKKSLPVCSLDKNPYGLCDILGNVWEWTCSRYDELYGGSELVCAAIGEKGLRVQRGGSWDSEPYQLRSAHRETGTVDYTNTTLGFRIVQEIQ